MGQKVHPLGFRVGITKKHQSQWFARFHKHKYAQTLLEDRFLRQTLLKLLPELVNPVLQKAKKRDDNKQIVPKITQIKIERGLIPYEIGIQIHAGNCELIKAAIDNLKTSSTLLTNLQKTRRYLLDLRLKLKDLLKLQQKTKTNRSKNSVLKNRALLKQRIKKQKLYKKRLNKHQNISRFFRQHLLENVIILKKGKKIIRKFQSLSLKKQLKNTLKKNQQTKINSSKPLSILTKTEEDTRENTNLAKSNLKMKKKFFEIFLNKTNKNFIIYLKQQMNYWNNFMKNHREEQINKFGVLRYAPLGYSKKWSLTRLERLQKQPYAILKKLLKSLQIKILKKTEILRKEFFIFGSFSKIQSFNYFQMIKFIKNLKQVVKQLRREQIQQKLMLKKQALNFNNSKSSFLLEEKSIKTTNSSFTKDKNKLEKSVLFLTEKVLKNKLNNIDEECRKTKFIAYLQDLVKKHRTKNIYYYLATLADSQKYLKKIQQFTKRHSNFLFGIDLQSLNNTSGTINDRPNNTLAPISNYKNQIKNRINKILKQTNKKTELEKSLQEVVLEQLQKQRIMCQQNLELTPKISIKFYSVKSQILESKASLVADSIVDDLEKRKAFRRVIKQAQENLMASSSVKGVKIQVSGRLNGAEIARTEWIRSGRVPLQTLRANIDYSYKTASTIYGIIGVKVWIYKGSFKKRQKRKVSNTLSLPKG